MTRKAVIVGAGLAGSLLAVYLARDGWTVEIYEKRSDPRSRGYAGGRSINLALSARGLTGLAGVGLDTTVMGRDAIPMPGRMIHARDASLTFQPYSKNPGDAINSVSRAGLNLTLIEAAAREPAVALFFDHACTDVDLDAPAAILERPGGGVIRAHADLVIGADGAYSPVRARLQRADRFDYSQSYLSHGYKELHIPAAADLGLDRRRHDGFAMQPNALHIWPRGKAMMIALPNRDKTFTCTLFWPWNDDSGEGHGLENLGAGAGVAAFFREHYSDAVPLMPTLAQDFARNPNGSLVTVRCRPWAWAGRVVLLGDAAHAIVPFYGQGMNCAFEDCAALARLLRVHAGDQAAALRAFEAERKPNADAIADMALDNFIEMRDKVGDPAFLYKKRLEQKVHELFPARVEPQYNLVSFSTVPYVEARRRGRELDALLDRIIHRLPRDQAAAMTPEQWTSAVRRIAADALNAAHEPLPSPVIDLTPAITERLGVWPGDTPLAREILCDLAKGSNITLSTIRATVHLGAHADGPSHYAGGAPGIGERSLRHYIGPCRVVDAPVARASRVRAADIVGGIDQIREPRLLIRTGTFPDPEVWNTDFAGLDPALVDALAARGVITIGIDTPSVDLQDSKDLAAHAAFARHDMAIIEGVVLSGIEPGPYELIALPLKLIGFDASPVRAVLRPIAPGAASA